MGEIKERKVSKGKCGECGVRKEIRIHGRRPAEVEVLSSHWDGQKTLTIRMCKVQLDELP